ncbi:tyrosine-protein kinase Src64B-like isoform X1 [Panulirus ornatus]|uniref:tyrosine-protein kinase Src64B-like isoform X1 n=1 Tax=Panulirus ornatus TaxID=150431 RepID=UPI003A836C24
MAKTFWKYFRRGISSLLSKNKDEPPSEKDVNNYVDVADNHNQRDDYELSHTTTTQQQQPWKEPTQEPVRPLPIVMAMHPFIARGPTELSFRKGDTMEIFDDSDTDWWFARHMETQMEGYVPVPYIASSSSLECQDWYFGNISRIQAEQLLLNKVNSHGAFLIRLTGSSHGYTLSVRTTMEGSICPRIKHFRIYLNENQHCYITTSKVFQTLNDLVDFYQRSENMELSSVMQRPCMKPPPEMNDISRVTRDQWEVERSTLQFKRQLGQGSFGEVWLGTWNNNVLVAIKMLKEGSMSAQDFLDEARIMKELRHPNILVLFAVCTREEPILIITEYMTEGSLLDYLRSESGQNLTIIQQIFIAVQVSAGMAYLEAKQLIHRDLAARNVLVGPSLKCKVADFGLARICEKDEYHSSNAKFPVKWTAPEAFLFKCFTIKSDVWSFGILMMEIITNGVIPYPGMSKQEVMDGIQQGYRMAKPQNCPDNLYELIYSCWAFNPTNRPTFAFINDFLMNYDVALEAIYHATKSN